MNLTRITTCIVVFAILASGQLPRAQAQTVYSCEGPAPNLDGTISPGEWSNDCRYDTQLQGPYQPGGDNQTWTPLGPPFYVGPSQQKSITLYVMRDDANVYLVYQWTQVNLTGVEKPARMDHYILINAFDFNHDGKFEDNDSITNTIDDALALVYLGFDIRIYWTFTWQGHTSVWLDIFIPKGLYEYSWNSTQGFQVIGGPGPTSYHGPDGPDKDWTGVPPPGPLYPSGSPVSFATPGSTMTYDSASSTYTYTLELAVPKNLFHSPAGFGFFLVQETANQTGGPIWPLWTWPSDLAQQSIEGKIETNPESAKLLGFLADNTDPSGVLDPNNGPSLAAPVGGVTAAPDKVALLLPWFAACAIVGLVTAMWIARKRKT